MHSHTQSCTLTHTHTHTLTLTHSLTHTHKHSLTHTHTHTGSGARLLRGAAAIFLLLQANTWTDALLSGGSKFKPRAAVHRRSLQSMTYDDVMFWAAPTHASLCQRVALASARSRTPAPHATASPPKPWTSTMRSTPCSSATAAAPPPMRRGRRVSSCPANHRSRAPRSHRPLLARAPSHSTPYPYYRCLPRRR
jgi:hypothetical protein